jgi:hypothetical protein
VFCIDPTCYHFRTYTLGENLQGVLGLWYLTPLSTIFHLYPAGHRPAANHRQTLSINVVSSTPRYQRYWPISCFTVSLCSPAFCINNNDHQDITEISLLKVEVRRVWRYQRGNQNPYIEEEQTTMAKRKCTTDGHAWLFFKSDYRRWWSLSVKRNIRQLDYNYSLFVDL